MYYVEAMQVYSGNWIRNNTGYETSGEAIDALDFWNVLSAVPLRVVDDKDNVIHQEG